MAIYIDKLPDNARPVKNTMNWIDTNGNVYGIETRIIPLKNGDKVKHGHYGEYFKQNTFKNHRNGYVYATFKYVIDKENNICKNRQRRVHIIVAETFIENPNNYPIVGHRNNIKSDNRVENLYWTTWKENTQKAVDDGLLVNDIGYEDSQSNPVIMFDTYTNKEIARYGSICIASEKTGISKNTISRQAKYKKPVRKPFYFRFENDESAKPPIVVVQYDFDTDKELGRYYNTNDAAKQTGISSKVISQQCNNNVKPQWTKSNTYFLYKV